MNPFLALCMIVKNEEKVLGRCLETVKSVVDEIIIVDTGSTDGTKDIALKYVDQVYDFKWNDSFAEARNFAQSKARAEWILVLDADEYVDEENLKEVVSELRRTTAPVDAYQATIYNFSGVNAESVVQHSSLRIYRNDGKIRYDRAVHEQLVRVDRDLRTAPCKLIVYHSGYMPQVVVEKEKNKRNIDLISKELNKNGQNPFDYFNLGNEYMAKKQYNQALEAFIKAYKNKKDFNYSWVPYCVVQIIRCLTELRRYREALNVIGDAEKIYVYSPDFICLKANIYLLQHRLDEVDEELTDFLANKEKYPRVITSVDYLDYWPHEILGVVYELKEDYTRAVEHYTKAFSMNPRAPVVTVRLLKLLSMYSSPADFLSFIERNPQISEKIGYIQIISTLLFLNRPEFAELFMDRIQENDLAFKGFQIKIDMCRGNFSPLTRYVKDEGATIEQLMTMIRHGCFDLTDLLIYGIKENQWSFMVLLAAGVPNLEVRKFVEHLIDALRHGEMSKDVYLSDQYRALVERCLVLRQNELFESLIPKEGTIDPQFLLSIGHLLFHYGMVRRACSFYERVDMSEYDSEAFVNLVQIFRKNNDLENALRYTLVALQYGHSDFRLFKDAVELLELLGFQSDIVPVVELALQHFPDSRWLHQVLERFAAKA